jgi:Tol biopolymer transport system component
MIDEHELREMLHRRANAVPTIPVDAPKAARRARRRLLANGAIAMLAAAAIAVATVAGVGAIRSAPVPADRPTPSPAPGVLLANREVLNFRSGDLVAVNPQTREERVLVKDLLQQVYSASWSADGRWVAYETGTPEGNRAIWVVGESQEPRQVATGGNPDVAGTVLNWMWSQTGADLATILPKTESYGGTCPDCLRGPYYSGAPLSTIDPVTGETTDVGSLPDDVGDLSSPVWSPDGRRFVFGERGGALYSLDVRSGATSLLVRLPGEHLDSVDRIVWSPDGAHIAVMNDLQPGGGRLYVMNADGSNVRVLVDDYDPADLAWSPDGTRLAYAGWLEPDLKLRISIARMDDPASAEIGSLAVSRCEFVGESVDECRQHPGWRPDSGLTWSPDGSRIAVRISGFRSVRVSAIDADGAADFVRIGDLTYRSWDGGGYSCEEPC